MNNSKGYFQVALLAAGLLVAGLVRADAVTDNARALLDKGDAKAAYSLLEPLETQRAGDPEYDFLLGLAALEVGKNTNAVFALERVLAVDPGHVRARAEIARAYLALGETKTAKQEFESVRQQGVPPEVAATIDKLISAVERIDDEGRTTVRGYAEATFGHDTNVNSATAASGITVPAWGGPILTLNSASRQQSDLFGTLGAGISVRHPLSREWALIAGLNASKRMNHNRDDTFDTGLVDTHLGLVRTYGKDVFSAVLQYNQLWVDNNRYREASGFTTQWQHNYDARTQSSLYVQYSSLVFPPEGERNANRFVIGANFAHALAGFKTVFYGGAYMGEEVINDAAFQHLGNFLYGARVGAQHEYHRNLKVFANLAYEHRRYGEDHPLLLRTRDDDQWNLGVGMAWTPAKNWVVTPQFQYTHNRSNLEINHFRREVVSVTVRREF